MEFLRKLQKGMNARVAGWLLVAASVGVALLAVGNMFTPRQPRAAADLPQASPAVAAESREAQLEERLASLLSRIEGAGRVSVMITLEESGAREYAQSETLERNRTEEEDSEGGSRLISGEKSGTSIVLAKQKDGGEAPIALSEPAPKVVGVLVVAQGAGDERVKAELTKAAYTALDAPPHRVVVVKMK